MSSRMNLKAKRELVRVVAEKYQRAGRHDKHNILEQFVAVTGYHRKHSIRLLNSTAELVTPRRTRRFRVYDEAVKQALVVLWEASDRICGKRLKALLPILVPALERHGHLDLEGTIRERLLSASASTIDRLLAEARDGIRGSTRPKRRAKTAVQRQVPIRTAGDWNDPLPGYVEADLVSHCGTNPGGSFVHTLTLTDVCTGWTECTALVVRGGSLVVEALGHLRTTMPFPSWASIPTTEASFLMKRFSSSVENTRLSSHVRVPTGRMTKHGWSKRTELWFAGWLATGD